MLGRNSNNSARQAPIVAIIEGDAEEASEFLEAGADVILRKPVTVAGVARALADAAALDRDLARSEAA